MKFIDFLNEIYTNATAFCETQGIESRSFMRELDEKETEEIIAHLCAKGKLNLAKITDKTLENVETTRSTDMLGQLRLTTLIQEYLSDENDENYYKLTAELDRLTK